MLKRVFVALGLLVSITALFALWRYLDQIDLRAVLIELKRFSAQRCMTAVALVTGYIIVNSCNEVILCRAARLQLPPIRPMIIAAIANAIGHSIGLAALSGGALRLRLYSALGVAHQDIVAIAAMSVLPFLLGAPCMIAIALLSHPAQAGAALRIPPGLAAAAGGSLLVILAAAIGLAQQRRTLRIGKRRVTLPSARFVIIELLLGMVEITLVASVLYLFLPAGELFGYLNFMGVYLIAVMVAQISNAPAGIGVLEAALITLLPMVATKQLLAAIIGYRAAFELLPLILALLLLLLFEFGSRSGVLGRLWRSRITGESST